MKFFFAARIDILKLQVRIESNCGDWITLEGQDCSEMPPYFGIELDEKEQDKLLKWLMIHTCN